MPGRGDSDRKPDGKFRKGHSVKSPGNPQVQALHRFQSAVRESQTPERLVQVLDEMWKIATGDTPNESAPPSWTDRVAAGRVYIERVQGKPKDQGTAVPADIFEGVGPVVDAASGRAAARSVVDAMMEGKIEIESAQMMLGCLKSGTDHELDEILERIERLEGGAEGR